jgi:hypothetical protein
LFISFDEKEGGSYWSRASGLMAASIASGVVMLLSSKSKKLEEVTGHWEWQM